MSSKERLEAQRDITVNRRARHEYHIDETVEAGIMLIGSEVKALREGKATMNDCYARIDKGEAWLLNLHISPYGPASQFGHDPTRTRKLLLHAREIERLMGKVKAKGFTLVPLRLYFKDGRAKVEVALARGKKMHDKRETLRAREAKLDIDRAVKSRNRG